MDFLYLLLGLAPIVVLLLNIKSTADLLCRLASGFLFLILYNTAAPVLTLPAVGINAVSALVCGVLGIPGGVLLLCLNAFV